MVQRELERYREDAQYFEEHQEQLLVRYPEKWVAIHNRQVVGAAKDLRRLIAQLQRKGIPPADTYRQYLSTKEDLLILPASLSCYAVILLGPVAAGHSWRCKKRGAGHLRGRQPL